VLLKAPMSKEARLGAALATIIRWRAISPSECLKRALRERGRIAEGWIRGRIGWRAGAARAIHRREPEDTLAQVRGGDSRWTASAAANGRRGPRYARCSLGRKGRGVAITKACGTNGTTRADASILSAFHRKGGGEGFGHHSFARPGCYPELRRASSKSGPAYGSCARQVRPYRVETHNEQ